MINESASQLTEIYRGSCTDGTNFAEASGLMLIRTAYDAQFKNY